jgi:nucleoside-diphosphate-sugar epimerase
MRVALVGGAGLIGHHLALRLRRQGDDVLVVDPLLVNNLYALWADRKKPETALYIDFIDERLTLMSKAGVVDVRSDARDYHLLSKILRTFDPDTVCHLAAVAHIDRANRDPYSTLDHSLRTLENALDVSRALKVKQFIFFSSSTVYGDFIEPVVTEGTLCRPKGIYGAMKLASELLVRAYGEVFSLPYTIIRPSALYGPRCVSGRVTQKFVENAYFGRPSLIEGDGSARIDFTYIEDLLRGVELALRNPPVAGRTFNITAGQSKSIAELGAIILRYFPNAQFKYVPVDADKPKRGTLSCAAAAAQIDYHPCYDLGSGMDFYIRWFKEFMARRDAHAA